MLSHLITRQTEAKKEIDRRMFFTLFLLLTCFLIYLFLLVLIPDIWATSFIILLAWPLVVIFCLVKFVRVVFATKNFWLNIQADYVGEYLQHITDSVVTETVPSKYAQSTHLLFKKYMKNELSPQLSDVLQDVENSLLIDSSLIVRQFSFLEQGEYYSLILYHSFTERYQLKFYWYTEKIPALTIKGTTYLVAESDFSHKMFKQFETDTTVLEWGQFEDLLHVETTDPVEARYLLPPDTMESIYDTWKQHTQFLARIKFSSKSISFVTGLKKYDFKKSETLIHDRGSASISEALVVMRSLVDCIQSSR